MAQLPLCMERLDVVFLTCILPHTSSHLCDSNLKNLLYNKKRTDTQKGTFYLYNTAGSSFCHLLRTQVCSMSEQIVDHHQPAPWRRARHHPLSLCQATYQSHQEGDCLSSRPGRHINIAQDSARWYTQGSFTSHQFCSWWCQSVNSNSRLSTTHFWAASSAPTARANSANGAGSKSPLPCPRVAKVPSNAARQVASPRLFRV